MVRILLIAVLAGYNREGNQRACNGRFMQSCHPNVVTIKVLRHDIRRFEPAPAQQDTATYSGSRLGDVICYVATMKVRRMGRAYAILYYPRDRIRLSS